MRGGCDGGGQRFAGNKDAPEADTVFAGGECVCDQKGRQAKNRRRDQIVLDQVVWGEWNGRG
jgi:hypothetical protein